MYQQRWPISFLLNARALFPIAEMLKYLRPEHFETLDEIRKFLFDTIEDFAVGTLKLEGQRWYYELKSQEEFILVW